MQSVVPDAIILAAMCGWRLTHVATPLIVAESTRTSWMTVVDPEGLKKYR